MSKSLARRFRQLEFNIPQAKAKEKGQGEAMS
jgi:hypothetical protein